MLLRTWFLCPIMRPIAYFDDMVDLFLASADVFHFYLRRIIQVLFSDELAQSTVKKRRSLSLGAAVTLYIDTELGTLSFSIMTMCCCRWIIENDLGFCDCSLL